MTKVESKKFCGNPGGRCLDRIDRPEIMTGGTYKSSYKTRRLWIFLVWGIVLLVCGLIIGGVYLNLRAITSSSQYTEIIPTYINAITVIVSGLLVLVLFWNRNIYLVFTCAFVNVGAAFINGIGAILLGTLIIPPVQEFLHCTFLNLKQECHCLSPYKRSAVHLEYSVQAPVTLIFEDSSNCNDIEVTLVQVLYALCGTSVLSTIVCIVAAILALLVVKMERRKGKYQDDTYDDIFTISNSNTPDSSDSENEQNILSRPILDSYGDYGDITESDSSSKRIHSNLQRSHSLKQPHKTNSNNFDSMERSISKDGSQRSKLKEHRRRDRRAVTLHNLDSKQLMLILSLQMRYLKETDNSKSQCELSAKKLDERLSRSFTPQPYRVRSKSCEPDRDVRNIRSHTPQPYQRPSKQLLYENLNEFYQNNFPQVTQNKSTSKGRSSNERSGNNKTKPVPHYEEIDDVAVYSHNGLLNDQIYANFPSRNRMTPKSSVGSEESEVSDIPVNCIRRSHRRAVQAGNLPNNIPVSDIPNPGRPKSYINAIDNPDPYSEELYSEVKRTAPLAHHAQSQPNNLNTYSSDTNKIRNTSAKSESIYARPMKKPPPPPLKRIPNCSSAPVIGSDRRSAFQVVQRSSEAGTGVIEFVDTRTNHNYAMYSVMDASRKQRDVPPPYSPPPCYNECLATSRDSSLQSSSSSHSASQDLYGKVHKKKPKFVYVSEPSRPNQKSINNDMESNNHPSNKPEPLIDRVVYGSADDCHENLVTNNRENGFTSLSRANYVINFDQEQPRVELHTETSDSDEMETVI